MSNETKKIESDRKELLNYRKGLRDAALSKLDFSDKGQTTISWDIENKLIPNICIGADPDETSCRKAIECLLKFVSANEDICSAVLAKTDDQDLMQKEYRNRTMHTWSVVNYLQTDDFSRYVSEEDMLKIIEEEYAGCEIRRDESELDVSSIRFTASELLSEINSIAKYIGENQHG